ncbi:TOTE conflict system archaeo-eukaryotic primase domain-containing protein [Collimonas antrihumi]|uniref:TOTE conflict system archaeo-eukaryotic primase domain-containing protein n=1 Tax=Collimonas antrihumi TaxID=1940615 RepID=UPI003CCE6CE9
MPARSPDAKIKLFRRLYQGRNEVYPVRWESQKTGKTGYSPVCANEWRYGVCDKPRIKVIALSYPPSAAESIGRESDFFEEEKSYGECTRA